MKPKSTAGRVGSVQRLAWIGAVPADATLSRAGAFNGLRIRRRRWQSGKNWPSVDEFQASVDEMINRAASSCLKKGDSCLKEAPNLLFAALGESDETGVNLFHAATVL